MDNEMAYQMMVVYIFCCAAIVIYKKKTNYLWQAKKKNILA